MHYPGQGHIRLVEGVGTQWHRPVQKEAGGQAPQEERTRREVPEGHLTPV